MENTARKVEVVDVYASDFGSIPMPKYISKAAEMLNADAFRQHGDFRLKDKRTRGGKLVAAVGVAVQRGINHAMEWVDGKS